MNTLYAVGALVAIGLAIYLCVALLKPEWFRKLPRQVDTSKVELPAAC